MQKHFYYYEQAFKLHGENCHLRTKLASWKSGEEIRKIRRLMKYNSGRMTLPFRSLRQRSPIIMICGRKQLPSAAKAALITCATASAFFKPESFRTPICFFQPVPYLLLLLFKKP